MDARDGPSAMGPPRAGKRRFRLTPEQIALERERELILQRQQEGSGPPPGDAPRCPPQDRGADPASEPCALLQRVDLASSGSDADRSDIEEVGRGSDRPSSPADAAPDDVTTAVGPAASSDTSAADVPASPETGRGAAEPYPAPRAPATPLAATPALRLTRAEMEQWDDPRFGDGTLVVDVKTAEGSLSTIWRATWTADGEPATVAVKELRLDASVRTEALRSFAQEVRICSRLRHANICSFLGTTLRNGSPALVLEYLGGGTLHHALHNPRRAPHTRAFRPHLPPPSSAPGS